MRIKQELFEEWVTKLRSEQYKQIFGTFISSSDAKCRCAAGLMIPENNIFKGIGPVKISSVEQAHYFASVSLRKDEFNSVELWRLNDIFKCSFTDIAFLVEKAQENNAFFYVPGEIRAD